jgi:hypothetical protein
MDANCWGGEKLMQEMTQMCTLKIKPIPDAVA